MQVETKKKRTSFSYSVAGEKLKLIDISSEDDFLIASPLFDSLDDLRLSVTWDSSKENEGSKIAGTGASSRTSAAEELLQRQQNKPSSMESGRPSYLRKSLAWDKAFFTSAGVLDADELSIISNGACQLPDTQQDVRARRPECSSDGDGFSVNSFLSSKEDGIRSGKMIKSAEVSKRDPINIQRLERTKTNNLQSNKPPKILTTKMKDVSSGQSKAASMGAFHGRMPDSKTTRTAQALLAAKTSASGSSCSAVRFSSSTPSVSSISRRDAISIDRSKRASSTKVSSTLLKNRPGSRKSKLSTTVSTSLESTNLKNLSFSTEILVPNQPQHKSPPANSTKAAADSLDGTPKGSGLSSLQSPRFISQETESTPSQLSEQALSGNSKPSSLRLPSPKIGFFDEVVPKARGILKFQIGKASKSCADEGKSAGANLKSQPAKTPTGTGKLKNVSTPRQLRSSASFRLTSSSPYSGASKHGGGIHAGSELLLAERSVECDREIFCKSRKVGAGERERRSVEVRSGAVKARKKRVGESGSTMQQVDDLSRRLELIDLWDDLKIDCKQETRRRQQQPHGGEKSPEKQVAEPANSSPFCTSRTPLADKTPLCNGNVTLHSPNIEKLVEKAPIFPPSQHTDKENI